MVIKKVNNTSSQYNGALLLREVLQEMVLPHPLKPYWKGARGLLLSKRHVKHPSSWLSTNIVANASSWMSPLTSGEKISSENYWTQHTIEQHAAFLLKWTFSRSFEAGDFANILCCNLKNAMQFRNASVASLFTLVFSCILDSLKSFDKGLMTRLSWVIPGGSWLVLHTCSSVFVHPVSTSSQPVWLAKDGMSPVLLLTYFCGKSFTHICNCCSSIKKPTHFTQLFFVCRMYPHSSSNVVPKSEKPIYFCVLCCSASVWLWGWQSETFRRGYLRITGWTVGCLLLVIVWPVTLAVNVAC